MLCCATLKITSEVFVDVGRLQSDVAEIRRGEAER
jgi:hypothetical protein